MSRTTTELLRHDEARLREKGLFGHPGDSLSVRIPGTEQFLLTTPDSEEPRLVSFRAAGNEASALHAAIYRSRPDAGALLVGRTSWSAALARIGESIPVLFDEQARRLGKTGKPLGAGRHQRVVEALAGGGNIAIYGDQRICVGATPDTVVFGAELFTKCAMAFVLAHSSGHRFKRLPSLVRYIAGGRLRKDQKRAAQSYTEGRIPDGMTGY
jgi:hypothetical protein